MRIVLDNVEIVAERNMVERPRALVLALHGGTYDARYWHHQATPDASLLALGQALNFSVVAIDRPGNGRSAEFAPGGVSLMRQVDILHQLIDRERDGRDLSTFIIGHSMGGVLGLMMAADTRGNELAGVDVAGVPMEFTQAQMSLMLETAHHNAIRTPAPPRDVCETMFYGPPGSYDPAVVAWGETEHSVPTIETDEVFTFPQNKAALCRRINIPIQVTVAEHERASFVGDNTLDDIAKLFAHNCDARVIFQRHAGHNISLHHVGRAYHLRAFAFFEECMSITRR